MLLANPAGARGGLDAAVAKRKDPHKDRLWPAHRVAGCHGLRGGARRRQACRGCRVGRGQEGLRAVGETGRPVARDPARARPDLAVHQFPGHRVRRRTQGSAGRSPTNAWPATASSSAPTPPACRRPVRAMLGTTESALRRIPDLRAQATGLRGQPSQIIGGYTEINQTLLAAVAVGVRQNRNPTVAVQMQAYLALLSAKEAAGIERAQLANVFTVGRFADGQLNTVVSLIAGQQAYVTVFERAASADDAGAVGAGQDIDGCRGRGGHREDRARQGDHRRVRGPAQYLVRRGDQQDQSVQGASKTYRRARSWTPPRRPRATPSGSPGPSCSPPWRWSR